MKCETVLVAFLVEEGLRVKREILIAGFSTLKHSLDYLIARR